MIVFLQSLKAGTGRKATTIVRSMALMMTVWRLTVTATVVELDQRTRDAGPLTVLMSGKEEAVLMNAVRGAGECIQQVLVMKGVAIQQVAVIKEVAIQLVAVMTG